MEFETTYSLANGVAALAWLALAVVPLRWSWPVQLARGVAVLMAVAYIVLLSSFWSRGEGGFGSLAGVQSLFETEGLLLAGWVHYLAFDLLVGSWERVEAARLGFRLWMLFPFLLFTFMFGPVGWLAFLGARWLRSRSGRAP